MLGLCANSAVLAEFHLRVNVRAPCVWNAPPANLQPWFINGFVLGLNTGRSKVIELLFISLVLFYFIFFVLMPSVRCFFSFPPPPDTSA